jgi:(+)-trans-carveol dehydrogenase
VETVPYPTATPDDLAETVRQVEALDRRIVAAEVDVRDLAGLTRAVEDGVAQLGRLDIVLANAGISTPASSLEMDEETWSTMIDVNLTGVWKTIRASVPHIVAGGRGGSVVITSSLAAIYANPNTAHYSAAKAGLIMLAKVLAKELAPQSIRVNTIHPTTVATDMILNEPTYRLFRPDLEHPTRADFEEAALTLNKLPIPAIEAVDISNAVLYLVSDDGRYVTGTTHVVDAGGQL